MIPLVLPQPQHLILHYIILVLRIASPILSRQILPTNPFNFIDAGPSLELVQSDTAMSGVKIFRGRQVLIDDELKAASVLVRDGKIVQVMEGEGGEFDLLEDVEVVDVGEDVLMPGLVDSHVHINEPGRTDWEGFRQGEMVEGVALARSHILLILLCYIMDKSINWDTTHPTCFCRLSMNPGLTLALSLTD